MFYLLPLNQTIRTKSSDILRKQSGTQPIIKETQHHKCLLYPKLMIDKSEVFFQNSDDWIFGIGTWSYKSKTAVNALRLVLDDIIADKLDHNSFYGQFIFLVCLGDKLTIYSDASGIMNIYKSKREKVISCSFLAILYTFIEPATLNHMAIKEVLCTGNLISPDTLVNEIKRYHPLNTSFGKSFNTDLISIKNYDHKIKILYNKSKEEAINNQINAVNNILLSFKELTDKNNTDIGITGGLDSRLLWSFALNIWDKKQLHIYTNSRKDSNDKPVLDEPISKKIANVIGLPLKLGLMLPPNLMSNEKIEEVISDSYDFSDGHIRMHIQYFEEYNTPKFKKGVLDQTNSTFNLSGIGGEHYRNQEYYLKKKWNGKKFLKYKCLKFISGKAVIKNEKKLIDYIHNKVKQRLDVESNKWSHLEVKKYYNEIINAERLGARNNMENKLTWFLSPFADFNVANNAYEIVDFLKPYPDFQVDLLKANSETLSGVYTDYGFIPKNGIPLKNKLINYIKALIPWNLLYHYRERFVFKNKSNHLYEKIKDLPFINDIMKDLEEVVKDVNFNELNKRDDLMPIVINMAYFISHELDNKTIRKN